MNRRAFFSMLAAVAAAAAFDPDRALWVPGRKLISIPAEADARVFIRRRCAWVFPTNAAQRLQAATNPASMYWPCGYNPRADPIYRSCDYTRESCIERGNTVAFAELKAQVLLVGRGKYEITGSAVSPKQRSR